MKSSHLFAVFCFVVLAAIACTHKPAVNPVSPSPIAREVSSSQNGPNIDWRNYANDPGSSKSTNIAQINRHNFKDLQVAWRWSSPDNEVLAKNKANEPNPLKQLAVYYNESTPIAINGYLYVSTALSQVAKIDGATGETLKVFDPKAYEEEYPPNSGYVHRGISYWESSDKKERRIFVGTGNAYVYALDADTLEVIRSFGDNGKIDLLKGLKLDGSDWPNRWDYGVTSPVAVCHDVIIVGGSIKDGIDSIRNARGDVRGFDARTGKKLWTFHTIPVGQEFGADTWKDKSNEYTGNTNVWTMMSVDEKLRDRRGNKGLVYLPVSTPTNDWYGGHRKKGKNKTADSGLFGESLVCLSCLTGKLVWHYQFVHHGLWDYDPPAAPNLVEIEVKGVKRKAVVQVTKQAFAYVLDRQTGKPIWPIPETPLVDAKGFTYGQSTVEGEETSPTQPIPSRPPAFDRQGMSEDDLIDFSDELREKAKALIANFKTGPLYTPPSDQGKGTLVMPGWLGGASWAGASFDATTQTLYVSSITDPIAAYLEKSPPNPAVAPEDTPLFVSPFPKRLVTHLDGKLGSLTTRPIVKPPYGRVTAIDLKEGTIKWQTPLGRGPVDDPEIKAAFEKNPERNKKWIGKNLGWSRRGHLLKLPDLLVVGQSGTYYPKGGSPRKNAVLLNIVENPGEQNLKAFDPQTGALIGEVNLFKPQADGTPTPGVSGNAYGAPISFMKNGEQYIVVPVGGANLPAEMVALKLPRK